MIQNCIFLSIKFAPAILFSSHKKVYSFFSTLTLKHTSVLFCERKYLPFNVYNSKLWSISTDGHHIQPALPDQMVHGDTSRRNLHTRMDLCPSNGYHTPLENTLYSICLELYPNVFPQLQSLYRKLCFQLEEELRGYTDCNSLIHNLSALLR